MSMRQTRAMLHAMLIDDSVGIRARVDQSAANLPGVPAGNPGPPSSDFNILRAPLTGQPRDSTRGNVAIVPTRWVTNIIESDNQREGMVMIEIGFETFGASHEDNMDEAELVATALMKCLDGLRAYSDANWRLFGAAIVTVASGVDFSFGDFEGPTSYGFKARMVLQEVSAND